MTKLPPRKNMHKRRVRNRVFTCVVYASFVIAILPLLSLFYTTIASGLGRFDIAFFTRTMDGTVNAGGGALHAIMGSFEITILAALIGIPLGLLVAIFLVEYGSGGFLSRTVALGVDVMAGIPSIVVGLFVYAFFSLVLDQPGIRSGFLGAVALSILMLPIVIRSAVEVLRLVPNDLREAAYALGTPKWRTILFIVLPTAFSGIATGSALAVARAVGETAPLLIVAGFTNSLNLNPLVGRMMTLPVYVYTQYSSPGVDVGAFLDRSWSAALVLIAIAVSFYILAQIFSKMIAPKSTNR